MRFSLLQRAAAAALLTAAAGCLGSTTEVSGTPAYTFIRIVQAVSDAPNGVDLAVNSSVTATGIPTGTVIPLPSSGVTYTQVPVGQSYAFAAHGSPFFYSNAPAFAAGNTFYTLIAYGLSASSAAPAATAAVIADTTAAAGGPVLVRAFNAVDYVRPAGSTTGATLDVYVYASGSTRPSTPTFAALQYGTRSAYATGATGTLRVDVFLSGAASTGAPLFSGTATTSAGSIRTFVLIDPPSSAPTTATGSVLVLTDGTSP